MPACEPDGMGRHSHNFSFPSFPRQAGALSHYALNSNDRDDRHVSRDTLVRLPSAYNYCFPGFSGGTITQLALSS